MATIKRITLDELLQEVKSDNYQEQYAHIMCLVMEQKIKPVKSSPTNGKRPALHKEYWLVHPKQDYSAYAEELRYQLTAEIGIDYYLRHLETYVKERAYVLALNAFLVKRKNLLQTATSFNERSFQIWQQEKYLVQGGGKTLMTHCGLDVAFLNCYPTVEPFAYYAAHRKTPQNILIVENKDTFFSMRQVLLRGQTTILGTEIGTLIYGKGKDVISSFKAFNISAEPYMQNLGNKLLYFGDLDYEGILIYENLAATFTGKNKIVPFTAAYAAMLKKSAAYTSLPKTKAGQNRNLKRTFFAYFPGTLVMEMNNMLQDNRYLPQEILTAEDF